MILRLLYLSLFLHLLPPQIAYAQQNVYQPARVVYDVTSDNVNELNHILDRVSLLQRTYGDDPFETTIVLVLHEAAIRIFAKTAKHYQSTLNKRAHSLTMGEIIQFRVCLASAKMQGFDEDDFAGFIKLVPMADAELVMLQNQGFAYLR